MIQIFILISFVVFVILIWIFILCFLIPFLSNLNQKLRKGEVFVSIFEMFVTVFVLFTSLFGLIALLL